MPDRLARVPMVMKRNRPLAQLTAAQLDRRLRRYNELRTVIVNRLNAVDTDGAYVVASWSQKIALNVLLNRVKERGLAAGYYRSEIKKAEAGNQWPSVAQ